MEVIEQLDKAERLALLSKARRLITSSGQLVPTRPNRISPDGLYGDYYADNYRRRHYKDWDDTQENISARLNSSRS